MFHHSGPAENPAAADPDKDMERQAAWTAALELFRCVECARLDLAQRLRLMARSKGWEITGDQPEDETVPVPEISPDGVRLTCTACQAPNEAGFFRPGTDELL